MTIKRTIRRFHKYACFSAVAAILLLAGSLIAEVPTSISYQGQLLDASDNPVPDGNYTIAFSIYDQAVGGTQLWTEFQTVAIADGLFAANLGTVIPLNEGLFSSATRYLGVRLSGDVEITPRTMLVSVPYAMRSATVDGASGGVITSKVTIGANNLNSGAFAFVAGEADTASADNAVVAGGKHNIASGIASTISGGHTHRAAGINSTISGGASNLADNAAATIGGGVGNRAEGDASTIAGGYINRANGQKSAVGGGFGNEATADFSTVPGGRANIASGSNSFAAGTRAVAQHSGAWVWGDFTDQDFSSSDTNQFLIRAHGGVGIGTNAPAAALHVVPLGGSQAATFDGDVTVNGTLAKSAGAFRIDHPLDPDHKYLQHSFVESPDMMNIYNGNVTTDADGYATVQLPEYFGALNRDFRYQLTVIGGFAQAIVAETVSANRFVIRTDKPNVKVSWQVTGVRHDKWADENRIEVEVDKVQVNTAN